MAPQYRQNPNDKALISRGFCERCQKDHFLGQGNTVELGKALIEKLIHKKTLDLFSGSKKKDSRLSTSTLFGPSRGKMFGVLQCHNKNGAQEILYAFSGQYNGIWHVPGWVPPILDHQLFLSLTVETEKEIKALTKSIESTPKQTAEWLHLRKKRKQLSQELMMEIHSLYLLNNFRGDSALLEQVFYGSQGIPTGTGDCCAPKLLQFAAQNALTPVGLSEFFVGDATKSGSHQHATFSAPCTKRCSPILGYMLCGLERSQ